MAMILIINHNNYLFRDGNEEQYWYEAVAVIEYVGQLSNTGISQGHYICDVKEANSKKWYRTNDGCLPSELKVSEVSQNAYVVLYKRVDE